MTPELIISVLCCVLLIGNKCIASSESIRDIIETHPNLTQFRRLIEQDGLHQAFLDRSVTIFAPSNAAFTESKFSPKDVESLILNHFANLALKQSQLPPKLPSLVTGNPPLWITKKKGGSKVFVNQARILSADRLGTSPRGEDQVLHILDSLLIPLTPLSLSSGDVFLHLNARKVLSKSTLYDLQSHSLRIFKDRALANRKLDMFAVPGKHTFFMPVDEAFQKGPLAPSGLRAASIHKNTSPLNLIRPELVSARVLEGHIVPHQLLFSGDEVGVEYPSVAWEPDGIRVNVSLENADGEVFVRSNTIVGDPAHARGIVLAKVLLGNIPLENGVLHIIDRPLMIVDKTLFEYVRTEGSDPHNRISRFAELLRDKGGLFAQALLEAKGGTLLIPNNEAMESVQESTLDYILGSDYLRAEWFGLHFVRERLGSTDKRLRATGDKTYSAPASLPNNRVWFHAGPSSLTVEARGVNASAVEVDIGAINGVIHVIDRVLGIPYQSLEHKLSSDPSMSIMNSLFQRLVAEGGFRGALTLLVPSDEAWARAEAHFSETLDSILQDPVLTRKLLERHMILDSVPYSFEDLVEKTRRSPRRKVAMVGADLEFAQIGEMPQLAYRDHIVKWKPELTAKVIRPNIECTNGYIHLLDTVLLDDSPPWALMAYQSSSGQSLLHISFSSFSLCALIILWLTG